MTVVDAMMFREMINEMVAINFNRTVTNSFRGELAKHRKKEKKKPPAVHRQQQRLLTGIIPNSNGFIDEMVESIPSHYLQAVRARFVLCPSGLGMDSYRLWETLLLVSKYTRLCVLMLQCLLCCWCRRVRSP